MTEITGTDLCGVIKRKHVAKILHEYLRTELNEPDEIDSTPAYILQDLFDCRVCAGHIIQVYVKGIMDEITLPDGKVIFDSEKEVSEEEMTEMLTKVCFPEFRNPRRSDSGTNPAKGEPEEVSFEQAKVLWQSQNTLTVDVRTEREYAEKHIKNAISAPLLSLIKNPFMFSENREKSILLYCAEGYQSKAAAQCLLDAGYINVAFFAWNGKEN